MNRIKSYIMLLCLMLSIGTAIHAQTKGTRFEPKKAATAELFFDSNVSVTASIEPQEVVVPIALASEVDITAFQADLYLPQQFILAGIDTGAIVTDTHEFTTSEKDGYTRIMCSSSNNSPFTSNYGIVARLRVIVPAYALGEFEMRLRNISLADTATPANRYDTYDQGGIIRANENPLWEPFCQVRDTLRAWMERVEEMAPGFAEEDSTWWAESGINSVIPQSPTAVLDSMIYVVQYKTTLVIATYDLLKDYNARLEMLLEMSKDLRSRTYPVYEDPKYEAFKDRLEKCLILNDECRAMLNEHYIYNDNGYFKETEPTAFDELQKKYDELNSIRERLEYANHLLFEVLNQGNNIQFADENVKAICVSHWDTDHDGEVSHWDTDRDGELSYDEAKAVTDLGKVFRHNANITSFNELQYFTGLAEIGFEAFENCGSLTSITIPNSVTTIDIEAFYSCGSLTSITIPNSVTTIGDDAFRDCESLTSITIPNSVTTIGNYAFEGCESLTSITIPNSVTTIGYCAFYNCKSLTSITIPNSVTTIGIGTFHSCRSLTSITIPNSVTTIGDYAFRDCGSLTSITIPNSVTTIGNHAFYACESLRDVYVEWNTPLSVNELFDETPIGSATLHVPVGTKALYKAAKVWQDFGTIVDDVTWVSIEFADANVKAICVANWDEDRDGELSYEEAAAVTSLEGAFQGANNITSFNELQYFTGLTEIGDKAFENCSSLDSITIPGATKRIGTEAFAHCEGLTNITIGNSVTSIGTLAFSYCFSLTSITIPNSVTSIGQAAFSMCSGLESINVEDGNANYDSRMNSNAIIETVTSTLIAGCKNTIIPDAVTTIGYGAFAGCTFTSITIPNSVSSIGLLAFAWCASLKDVYVDWQEPIDVDSYIFNEVPVENATLYVPRGTKNLYKAAKVWKDFGTIDDGTPEYGGEPIEFADANVRKVCIDNWDFNGDGEFTTGEAEHVYDLGDAFKSNTNIKSFLELKYFTGLEKITNENFMGCTNLKVMACEKQNLEIEDQVMTHPNAMLYIYGGVNSNFGGNTIWYGEAKEIVLTDGEELDIPVEFYAEQISYTRNFEKKTYPGVCAGWETIVLPFDVYSITHETKGQLAPIHSGLAGKSFWLGTLQDRGGFMNDVRIRANVPYLISMPNSDSYADQYNLNGKVTFSSENVMVRRTNEVESIWGSTYALVPTYDFIDAPDIYTINDDTYMNYYPGGVFTKGLRSARPFEAFVVVEHGNAKGYIDLFGDDPSGIADIMPAINESHEVYDLNGRKVATDGKALSRMPHGVYIIDGKKIVK